jgi:hypothetical protein
LVVSRVLIDMFSGAIKVDKAKGGAGAW